MFIDMETPARIGTGPFAFDLGASGLDTAGGVYSGLGVTVSVPSLKPPINGAFSQHTFSLSGVSAEAVALINADRAALRKAPIAIAKLELDPDDMPDSDPMWLWNGVCDGPSMVREGRSRPVKYTVSLKASSGRPCGQTLTTALPDRRPTLTLHQMSQRAIMEVWISSRRLPARMIVSAALASGLLLLTGCGVVSSLAESFRHPAKPFEQTPAPPAPDYAQPQAWMAFPGLGGLERSTPPGYTAVDEASAPADVFFIHPTSYLKNDLWNAAYDVDGPYNKPILLGQLSAFNGCCRLYAPHYRQASLTAQGKSAGAVQLAYSDVARAFRYYIDHENHGRPFIIASHSQGSRLAVELLQSEILGKPLQQKLVAAYVVGAFAPSNFGELGLPSCTSARQTGCIVSWNTSQTGRTSAFMLIHDTRYWWRGGERKSGQLPAICVNPLTWTETGAAPASANAGSLAFPTAPFPTVATTLPALNPHLTGAVCKDRLLDVDVPKSPPGYRDTLSFVYGSYHRSDYGLFYAAIHANAIDRVAAWTASQAAVH